ncbi:hypothetical protein ABL78_3529 [Leptomonas seymouri]|uniref:Uncharacterized protein n=1 Tax=Leptomonas seymouri TaxID=5684 RepID=A0A0N1IKY5_LEPSE|nr:hypothetical protein ABL78_3529 [Leptomonas seymouri]|eukprot:KPI87395.1 hypothetical protein ABL78_3529 [Leptomonas seymouri]
MGAAPSRETIRRGFFNVNQANPSSGGGGGGSGNSKRREIVLIPLTKEYFPSPDCPLFVQFHKARCDAAVNYYFRRPGNPGDLSCIPNYAGSYRLPGEETGAQRRRRRQLERAARAAEAAANSKGGGEGASPTRDCARQGSRVNDNVGEDSDDDSDEDDSFPSREALYRGVIDRVEEALFDTDAEMRQAYHWALNHPHTTMGPDGKKQRKVLPVLCAVAFRSDISKVHGLNNVAAAAGNGRLASNAPAVPPVASPSSHMSSSSISMQNMQAALENGVYMCGSIINIVGCFGFVSMQEDVDNAQRMSHQADSSCATAPPLLTPGSMQSHPASCGGGTYHHDPYSFTSSQASSGSFAGGGNQASMTTASGGTLLSSRGGGRKGARHLAQIGATTDLMTLPPPVAAPLAAMVFLTKSAGEQNLGRVTHIAASTYYYQMIYAGLIERHMGVRMEGPNVYPSSTSSTVPFPLPYGSSAAGQVAGSNHNCHSGSGGAAQAPPPPPMYSASSPFAPPAGSPVSSPTAQGAPKPFLPPMETFSFSSLLTNIPVLSFLYEMKWRWGYLGVLKAGTPTGGASCDSSFNGSVSGHPMGGNRTARGPGSMMENHSTGGLAAIDGSVGQGVTDELEMWITVDQMIHGRISKDLAQRLCWSLAERPEVMQERVSQLPSEESGYWRYRGLVDQTHLPPIPEPGKVVTIHPKDVYVMGSDVLPGFNEGDILRFDPERLLWFADHSIPLEGLVLAAMRPYCKQAREADSEDPSWVTKVCDAEEAEALHAGESDNSYPTPAPTAEAAALLASDPSLVHVHEHVGNFYVYRFTRDGTTYYYGTVPNFANPNKRKQLPNATSPFSQGAHATNAVATALPSTANHSGNNAVAEGGAHSTDNAESTSTNAAAKVVSNGSSATGTAGTTNNSSKPAVQVPKSIASALFSLLPASRSTVGRSSGANTAGMNGGTHAGPSGAANNGSSGAAGTASTDNAGNTSTAAAQSTATTYLATPVTSNAISTARKWVQVLYSYAYGAPNTAVAAEGRRGPTAASLAAGTGALRGASTVGPSSLASRASIVPPLRSVSGDGVNVNGSYPSTSVLAPRVNAKTPTTGSPNAAAAACDVSVWPAPNLIGVTNTGTGPHLSSGDFSAGAVAPSLPSLMSPEASPFALYHSRSSPSLVRAASGQAGEATAPTVASKPIKRYVEGGCYEWDWRKQ